MHSSMYGATGVTELKKEDAWEVAKRRCPEFWNIVKDATQETLHYYSSNTLHHVMVFERIGLPKDIHCVWSFFSGYSPEFLALEQYIDRKFTYTAIDCNFPHISAAKQAYNGNSKSCDTNFINDDLENWLEYRNVKIDRGKKHLLYFGHPFFEEGTKELIAGVLRKFQGCQFYIYGGFYILRELKNFLEVLDTIEFLPKERLKQRIEDPNVKKVPATYGNQPIILVQPNSFTLLGASPQLQHKLFPAPKLILGPEAKNSANEPLLPPGHKGCCVIL